MKNPIKKLQALLLLTALILVGAAFVPEDSGAAQHPACVDAGCPEAGTMICQGIIVDGEFFLCRQPRPITECI